MKTGENQTRAVIVLAVILITIIGIFLISENFLTNASSPERVSGKSVDLGKAPHGKSERNENFTIRRERAEKMLVYSLAEGGRETLRVALDKAMLRGSEGEEIVAIEPPATPLTLARRLSELSTDRRVFPIAYIDNDEMAGGDNLRVITSGLRVKMPREQAERLAAEYDLKIDDFPSYAPEWVIFDASAPLEALAVIDRIRGENEVASADVLIGRRPTSMALPNDPRIGNQWYLKRSGAALAGTDINVENAWKYGETGGVRGAGITIGIIDSGIQTNHPDFAGNYDAENDRDFVDKDNDPSPSLPGENHATAVAGVAGARGNNSIGVSGVAPEATLIGQRLIAGVSTTDQQDADAIAYRMDSIHIKNNSWGFTGPFYQTEPLLSAALRNSATSGRNGKGTIFTFSAGNSGEEEESANLSELTSSIYTIAVGATDSLSRRAYYSEPGANLVITAPSNGFRSSLGITTTDRTGPVGYSPGDYTDDFSGTSSSCPVVSGVIALMLEKNPNLGWRDVQEILIRTAKKFNPAEPGWLTNAAGLHFNNDYGAGLVDATAAVELAATWTNLAPQASVVSRRVGLNTTIPNNSSLGTTTTFSLPTSNIVTEHVTLKLNVSHSARGDLEITLTSPSGTISSLASVRSDTGDNYPDYTFSTVQNWGENSSGNWILKIADRKSAANTTGGKINSAELTVYGVVAPPVNPPPNVQITTPDTGSVFSPNIGYTVDVDVSDFDIDGNEDSVTQVELFENDISVAVDTQAPFTFSRNPAIGAYRYTAKATDPDGLTKTSLPVFVVVKNQTPVINTALVDLNGQAYDDTAVTVTDVDVTDAEMDTISIAYLWQFSTDDKNYSDSTFTQATLPANLDNSGKLWRCHITATDGNTTSEPFLTPNINLLDRPLSASFRPGDMYGYQSGLVLKGDELFLSRQAIIHEFSQGPAGGTSEWVEILTLKAGSLSGWTVRDAGGRTLLFSSAGIWNNIPAGTLILVYNGTAPKDPLLPADSADSSSGKMILSSSDPAFFADGSVWPPLDNLGDSIFLSNQTGASVHEISYGNSLAASPHIGSVISGSAAYYSGKTDAGASLSGEWIITKSTSGRTLALSDTAESSAKTDAVNPGVTFTNARYMQNFNVDPGDSGVQFPLGWSGYNVDISGSGTTNIDQLTVFDGGTTVGGVYNFGSKIGLYGGTRSFDPGFIALGIDNTFGITGLKLSYDVLKIADLPRSMDFSVEYTTGNPKNTGTVWQPIPGTNLNTGSTPAGTVNKFANVTLPAIFENRESPIYLRWFYRTTQGTTSAGGRDAMAIDNVIISSDASPNIFLTLALNPQTVIETAGENASTGTITLSQKLPNSLTVNLLSSDVSEATVPATVIIPANQLSATFPIRAIDDDFSDGPQTVGISATAVNFMEVTAVLTVTDDEPVIIGVTPGLANNQQNKIFVDRLRAGRIIEPALFRLADGFALPAGLNLNPLTGQIGGTVASGVAPGVYPITIELTNVLGDVTSQMISISIVPTGSLTFNAWLNLYPDLSDKTSRGDPDSDQLPNLIEYKLNSLPGAFDQPSPILLEMSATEISLTYTESKNRDDVTLVAEWSTSLSAGSWQTATITSLTLSENSESRKIKASLPVSAGAPKKFMRLRALPIAP